MRQHFSGRHANYFIISVERTLEHEHDPGGKQITNLRQFRVYH